MRIIGRLIAILLVLVIIPTVAAAFWIFNADRVATDRATYADALRNARAHDDLFQAIVEGFSRSGVSRHAESILKPLTPDQWTTLAAAMMPNDSAQKLVTTNIDAVFNWIDGSVPTLQAGLDLTDLKQRMSGKDAQTAINSIIARLPPCKPDETLHLTNFSNTDSFSALPLCNSPSDDGKTAAQSQWQTAFTLLAQHMPDRWNLIDAINTAAASGPPNGPASADPNARRPLDIAQLEQIRSAIWLQQRLLVLLFLIPIGLMCLIVTVTIRSGKGFFRWVGWTLISSGFFSLIPIFLIPFGSRAVNTPNGVEFAQGTGTGGQALDVLLRGMVQSILSSLTLSVVLQVAALIVVGLVGLFISILIAPPEPELSDDEMAALLAAQSTATPAPGSVQAVR